MQFVKAHAYGNDFLIVPTGAIPEREDVAALARRLCDRHRGLGADGLMIQTPVGTARVRMKLFNADGSYSELSGNGVRCMAAALARERHLEPGGVVTVQTDAGDKRLTLLESDGSRYRFRAAMGQPADLRQETLTVAGEGVTAAVLRVGNPQCVVLEPLSESRLHAVGAALAVHPFFPEGTNVEFASIESPDRINILIWERGVGPTEASGTGACAVAIAAAAFGGADRIVDVVSPGGMQRVEWTDEEIWLTGWAELIATGEWL